jgi:hypothetical protein
VYEATKCVKAMEQTDGPNRVPNKQAKISLYTVFIDISVDVYIEFSDRMT